jgi:hypothetical protein
MVYTELAFESKQVIDVNIYTLSSAVHGASTFIASALGSDFLALSKEEAPKVRSNCLGEDVTEGYVCWATLQVGMDLICEPLKTPRKTKIVCTLGPSCWGDEGLTKLVVGGMNIARFNFSHGSHQDHQMVGISPLSC